MALDAFALNAVTKHALGMFKRANAFFNRALGLDPKHYAWYQRQLMLWWQIKLDTPVSGKDPMLALTK